jgi:hypothetical protein
MEATRLLKGNWTLVATNDDEPLATPRPLGAYVPRTASSASTACLCIVAVTWL